jgi:hypothetical protein
MGGVFDVGKFGLGRQASPVATVHSTRGEKKNKKREVTRTISAKEHHHIEEP